MNTPSRIRVEIQLMMSLKVIVEVTVSRARARAHLMIPGNCGYILRDRAQGAHRESFEKTVEVGLSFCSQVMTCSRDNVCLCVSQGKREYKR